MCIEQANCKVAEAEILKEDDMEGTNMVTPGLTSTTESTQHHLGGCELAVKRLKSYMKG